MVFGASLALRDTRTGDHCSPLVYHQTRTAHSQRPSSRGALASSQLGEHNAPCAHLGTTPHPVIYLTGSDVGFLRLCCIRYTPSISQFEGVACLLSPACFTPLGVSVPHLIELRPTGHSALLLCMTPGHPAPGRPDRPGQATTVAPSYVTRKGWPTHNVPPLEALWRPASSESTMLPAHIQVRRHTLPSILLLRRLPPSLLAAVLHCLSL